MNILVMMDFSLDDPFFSDSITDMQDAPKSSGSSSASKCHPQSFYTGYYSRMGSIDCEKHLLCIRCRGYQCSVNLRCEECENWSKEEMLVHEMSLKLLTST